MLYFVDRKTAIYVEICQKPVVTSLSVYVLRHPWKLVPGTCRCPVPWNNRGRECRLNGLEAL